MIYTLKKILYRIAGRIYVLKKSPLKKWTSYDYPFAFFSFNNGFGFRDSTGVSIYDNHSDKVILKNLYPIPNVWKKEKQFYMMIWKKMK
jgi:hypothetical protein